MGRAGLTSLVAAIALAGGCFSRAPAPPAPPSAPPPAILAADSPYLFDDFSGALPVHPWAELRFADLAAGSAAEVVDGRLRVRVHTMGTDDATVKVLGVRTTREFDLAGGLRIRALLDWNDQGNGSYLSMGIALVPAPDAIPTHGPDEIAFQFVGVPPGKNVRPLVEAWRAGDRKPLYTEGWPETRAGRAPKPARVALTLFPGKGLALVEDGTTLWTDPAFVAPFPKARVALFATSHSNYPPREVFFDDVAVGPP